MTGKRRIEVFSGGCALCDEAVEQIRGAACASCEIVIHNMRDIGVVEQARWLGVRSVPAVVIDGHLASCCTGAGIDLQVLRDAGLGHLLP